MRISKAGLLIVLAFAVPLLIEARTLAGMFGISVSLEAFLLLSVIVFAAILAGWALGISVPGQSADSNGSTGSDR